MRSCPGHFTLNTKNMESLQRDAEEHGALWEEQTQWSIVNVQT